MTNGIKNCTVDGSPTAHPFFSIDDIPIFNNVLWDTREEALNAAKGDMELAFCDECGHIFNARFEPDLMDYDVAYENSLHFSPRFVQYIENLTADLIKRHNLKGKKIIDVGCGKGDFLKLICEMGGNTGYGFDKSYEPTPEDDALENVTFIQDFFTEKYMSYEADMIACRHVLEHIQYPTEFLQGIRRAIGDKTDTLVFFEVPNGLYTLRDMGIWDIIYEHCSYFTPNSLIQIFADNGFAVQRIEEVYGGQFLTIEAKPVAGDGESAVESDVSLEGLDELVQVFSSSYQDKLHTWQTNLKTMRENGQKVVIWGSGSKGVTFLNALQTADDIAYAVDINPRKQGKFVAGSGQQIVAPDFLTDYQPDVVLIMNPLYQAEIENSLHEMNLNPEFYLV